MGLTIKCAYLEGCAEQSPPRRTQLGCFRFAVQRHQAIMHGDGDIHRPLCAHLCQAAFFRVLSDLTALSTSSTWPGTFRPRHSCTTRPSGPIRKVLRSMPLTFLPYMILFLTTPNM